jgi:hypothetical protein
MLIGYLLIFFTYVSPILEAIIFFRASKRFEVKS